VLARSDSAGATRVFGAACRKRGAGFSFGFPVDERIQKSVNLIPDQCWHPAVEDADELREGAWVAEATGMTGLSSWPEGSRLILRNQRPHPGAQLTFTDVDGHRIPAFLTGTGPGVIPGQAAGLELRHRQHARVEDRIRQAKAAGLRNLPCRGQEENSAWLEAVLAAADLVCWAKLICFSHVPSLARCEIAAFRYRVLHAAAQLTRSARPPHAPRDPAARRPHLAVDRSDRRRLPPAPRRIRLTSPPPPPARGVSTPGNRITTAGHPPRRLRGTAASQHKKHRPSQSRA